MLLGLYKNTSEFKMVQGQICLSLHCVLGKEKPYCCSKGLEHNVYNLKLAALENVGNYVEGTL